MRQSSDKWLHHDQLATKQAGALPEDFDYQAFSAAVNETVHAQTAIFDLSRRSSRLGGGSRCSCIRSVPSITKTKWWCDG